ncbi:MAG: polymer-forming cytoskeletal protein [Patescibacteria group bacterium]
MIKKTFACLLLICCMMFPASTMAAVDFRSGEEIDLSTQVFADDVMVAGAMLSGAPEIKGDSFIVGSSIDLKGRYGDDLNVAGSQVDVSGEIADDLRMAGGNVSVDARIGGNVFIAGGQVDINEYSVIAGDVYVAGGMVTIGGEIKGKLHVSGGKVILNGIVDGNTVIEAEDFSMGEDAKVLGDLKYVAKERLVDNGEENVSGKVEFTKFEDMTVPAVDIGKAAWVGQVSGWLVGVVMMFVVGLLFVLLFKKFSDSICQNYVKKMGWSLLIGLLMWIVIPVLSIIVMITVVGIPLGIMMLLAYGIVWYLAKVMAGLAVGSLILSRKNDRAGGMVLSLAIGLLVTELISVIPFVGWLFDLVLMLAGMGAIGMLFGKKVES